MRLIENYIARAERLVNYTDWVPGISSFSGMIRILASAVQLAASAVLTMCSIVWTNQYADSLHQGFIYTLHSFGNLFRGSLAMIPGFGNALLFIHDQKLGRMNYPKEILPKGVYPLMQTNLIDSGSKSRYNALNHE